MNIGLLLIFSLTTGRAMAMLLPVPNCYSNSLSPMDKDLQRKNNYNISIKEYQFGIGCAGGWVKFNCKNPCVSCFPMVRTKKIPNEAKNVTVVVVKDLQQNDNFNIYTGKHEQKIQIVNCSLPQINHVAPSKSQTTIGCGFPASRENDQQIFLYKETNDFDRKDVKTINKHANYTLNSTGLYITFTEVTLEDQGTYWCVVQGDNFNWTYRRVFFTVHADTSTDQDNMQRMVRIVTGAMSVTVMLLTLVAVIMVLKHCKRRNDSSEWNRTEDNVYEEIQHPDTGGGLTTVYATAESCKESLHFVRLDFGKSPKALQSPNQAPPIMNTALCSLRGRTNEPCPPQQQGDALQS
ncbi:uncharacterized protein LOC129411066 [Boleophthalmus pectinirostris]|uniref:uncharacterized protein LOC129411066 n=1 Tax=Boleophthalmus pectinirostris TaxID=150288 RepID=UPI0024328CCF|nr:uncharacterized protein LOC129411066 [Boleophthalmus pectinirostris]